MTPPVRRTATGLIIFHRYCDEDEDCGDEGVSEHRRPKAASSTIEANAPLHRYFDATPFVEYLYVRVVATVRTDLHERLRFLTVFEQAMEGLRAIVAMPDRRAALLIRLMLQNSRRLSAAKRGQFSELSDDKPDEIGAAI